MGFVLWLLVIVVALVAILFIQAIVYENIIAFNFFIIDLTVLILGINLPENYQALLFGCVPANLLIVFFFLFI